MAFAQIFHSYGVKLGVVAARQNWDISPLVSTEARWGLDVGGFVEPIQIAPVSILGEMHYIQKGTKYIATETYRANNLLGYEDRLVTYNPRLDYLSFAVFGKLSVEVSILKVSCFAGPRLDVVIGKEDDGLTGLYDKFKQTDFGTTLGLGFESLLIREPTLSLEFRYSPSLIDAYTTTIRSVKNDSFEILVGIQL